MLSLQPSALEMKEIIKVARGCEAADMYIHGGMVANVYSGEYLPANVAIKNGRIAYLGMSEEAVGVNTEMIDATGKYLCPGYVEVHAHPWVIYNPVEMCRAILPLGTTTAFCDTLFFYILAREEEGFKRFLIDMENLPLKVFWSARIAPQTATPEEKIKFATERIQQLINLPNIQGIAEITRWPLILDENQHLMDCVATARSLGKRIDGHTAGCSYEKLNPVVAAGIDSCHEAIDVQQAIDRLRLGLYVFLRDSSLRQDLRELIRIVTENNVTTSRLALTTDGPSPYYFDEKGSVEYLADLAVQSGVNPMIALQMITINPATYFHLEQYIGGIAPGKVADIVINGRKDTFKPDIVVANGQVVAREGHLVAKLPTIDWKRYTFESPSLPNGMRIRREHLMVRADDAEPNFPIMDLISSVITRRRDVQLPKREGFVDLKQSDGLLHITLLGKRGQWATNGIIKGFARDLEGLASSYNTAGQVLVLGKDSASMAIAANRVYDIGGGIVLVENGRIIYEFPLELGGMMSQEAFGTIMDRSGRLVSLLQERGYPYDDVFYTILFLACDFLPEIRLTYAGVFDVKTRTILKPHREIF